MKSKLTEALGSLVVAFSRLEAAAAYGITEFFPPSEYKKAELVAFELSFKKRLDVLVSLANREKTRDEYLEALKKVVATASHIEERRNEIIHSHWEAIYHAAGGVLSVKGRRVRIRARRKGALVESELPKVPEIVALAKQADLVAAQLHEAACEASIYVEKSAEQVGMRRRERSASP